MTVPAFLLGGGWSPGPAAAHYGALLAACRTEEPTVACLVLDEGDGAQQHERYAAALRSAGPCRPVPVLVPEGEVLDPAALGDADALLVCGGLTPAYAQALAPGATDVVAWLEDGRPYAGFSAGAAVAASRALVGGWRSGGVPVCPDDAGEDLDELTVAAGLGLVPFTVDVHCASWGTLSRLVTAVGDGRVGAGVALDEDTLLTVTGDRATVSGAGSAWVVTPGPDGVAVRRLVAGDALEPLPGA